MQKQYAALVWISRPVQDEDFQAISSLKEIVSCYTSFFCYFPFLSKGWAGCGTQLSMVICCILCLSGYVIAF